MRIVVTGALGHIGSRLIREIPFAFPDAEIVMMDDLSTQRYCSLFNLPVEGRYSFHQADVLTTDLASLFAGADAVVHLAAITDATTSFEKKEQVEEVNYIGSKRVAQACVIAECPLIFPSTTSVYGTQDKVVDEDCPMTDLKPQSPYAESKLKAEQLLQEMGDAEGLRFVICRFGTIFGTSIGMRFHTAINKFCWQAVMGQPITVWRTAWEQDRPYLELGDAINALKLIVDEKLWDRELYNVVTTNTSVRQIVKIISSYLPDATVQFVDTQIMNQLSYHVSNTRFRKVGFEFRGDLKQGIGETISLLRQTVAGDIHHPRR